MVGDGENDRLAALRFGCSFIGGAGASELAITIYAVVNDRTS
jgi:hypothetical protein